MAVFMTGTKNNTVRFHEVSPSYDAWRDQGGTDTLVLRSQEGLFLSPAWHIRNTADGLEVAGSAGETLRIEGDHAAGEGAEYIRHKVSSWKDGQTTTEVSLLEIVTGPLAVNSLTEESSLDRHIAVIAGRADNVIQAPPEGASGIGFSEIYGNRGNDDITLSDTFQFKAYGGRGG